MMVGTATDAPLAAYTRSSGGIRLSRTGDSDAVRGRLGGNSKCDSLIGFNIAETNVYAQYVHR